MGQFKGFGIHNREAKFQRVGRQCAGIDRFGDRHIAFRSFDLSDAILKRGMQTGESNDTSAVRYQTAVSQIFVGTASLNDTVSIIYDLLPLPSIFRPFQQEFGTGEYLTLLGCFEDGDLTGQEFVDDSDLSTSPGRSFKGKTSLDTAWIVSSSGMEIS